MARAPRKKTARFEVKRATVHTYRMIPANSSEAVVELSEACIPNEHVADFTAKIRAMIGGSIEVVKGREARSDFDMLVDAHGKRHGVPMNDRASDFRYQWLAKHQPDLTVEECEYHSLIVGDVVSQSPHRGFVVINRSLNYFQIEERLENLKLAGPHFQTNNRVYCLYENDATAISLAIRTEKVVA